MSTVPSSILVGLDASSIGASICFKDIDAIQNQTALRMRVGPTAAHRDLSFGELLVESRAVAAAMVAQGCRPRDRVALLLPQSEVLVVGFLGALYVDLVPAIIAWPTVKMDSEKYQRNLRSVLAGLQAQFLLTDEKTAAGLGGILGQTKVIKLNEAPMTFGARELVPQTQASPDRVAFIQFSGGTTGSQKSVPITFGQLAAQLQAYAQVLVLGPDDRFVSWLPLYHDMGLIACLVLPFLARLPLTLFSPIEWVTDPRPFLKEVGSDRSTLCWLPNFAFAFMAKKVRLAPGDLDLSSLRAVVNCSEPVRAESMEAFAKRFATDGFRAEAIQTCYAMAEATFAVSQSTLADPPRHVEAPIKALGEGRLAGAVGATRTLVSCGKLVPGMEVRIVAPNGKDSQPDQLGEIWIRGASILDDYLDGGGQRRAFTDGWYRSGDLGFLHEGHLYVTGRMKDVIIVGGVNIYPEDVEAAAGEVAGVHGGRAVALGVPNEELGTEGLVLVAEVDREADLARAPAIEAEIRAAVKAMVGLSPNRVLLVPPKWIVKSTAGKISRTETRARVMARWDELTGKRSQPEGA
jgi:fatty-acyl-CoA synthase